MRYFNSHENMYPTDSQIKNLHLKYAPSQKAFDIIFTHSQIIWQICQQIIQTRNLSLDKELVRAGSLLHDIGGYKLINSEGTFDEVNYIKHGVIGYEILVSENLPEPVCLIAKRHTGLGITKEQIIKSKLPLKLEDYVPQTPEERLVLYADKFHSKNPRFNSFEGYSQTAAKFGQNNVEKFQKLAAEFGIPDLTELSKNYRTEII